MVWYTGDESSISTLRQAQVPFSVTQPRLRCLIGWSWPAIIQYLSFAQGVPCVERVAIARIAFDLRRLPDNQFHPGTAPPQEVLNLPADSTVRPGAVLDNQQVQINVICFLAASTRSKQDDPLRRNPTHNFLNHIHDHFRSDAMGPQSRIFTC